jgi:hypothetical protein
MHAFTVSKKTLKNISSLQALALRLFPLSVQPLCKYGEERRMRLSNGGQVRKIALRAAFS